MEFIRFFLSVRKCALCADELRVSWAWHPEHRDVAAVFLWIIDEMVVSRAAPHFVDLTEMILDHPKATTAVVHRLAKAA